MNDNRCIVMKVIMYLLLLVCGCFCLHRVWKKIKPNNSTGEKAPPKNDLLKVKATDKMQKEDLAHCLDMVNSWIGNCDQKAGIILSSIGVALTILMTSDYMIQLHRIIFVPFFDYWKDVSDLEFDFTRFMVFIFLLITLVLLTQTSYMMIRTITPNTDYEKMYRENPALVPQSYIYYKTIAEMDYATYKADEVSYIDDLKSQIYVNSKIASSKFVMFSRGLYWLKMTICFAMLLFFSIMFL